LQRRKPQQSLFQIGLKRKRFETNFEPLPPRRERIAVLGERKVDEAQIQQVVAGCWV